MRNKLLNQILPALCWVLLTFGIAGAQPTVSFQNASDSQPENVEAASVVAVLSNSTTETVQVDYIITGGTATGGGVDYFLSTGTLTFSPQQTQRSFNISIINDDEHEPTETIRIMLQNPINAVFGSIVNYTYFIQNDDTLDVGEGLQFETIQSAIDAAFNGDIVVVQPGTYTENINFNNKHITVRSTNPEDATIRNSTIIDGDELDSVVTFSGGENENALLSGFRITNGLSQSRGGGVRGNGTNAGVEFCNIINNEAPIGGGIYGVSGTIQNNSITENRANAGGGDGGGLHSCHGLIFNNKINLNIAEGDGGGIYFCNGEIRNNRIHNNLCVTRGGGISDCSGEEVLIINNIIYLNTAGPDGGGIYNSDAKIFNNTIYRNQATTGGGGIAFSNNATISNTIFWANTAAFGAQVHVSGTPSYSCIQDWTGGGEGNINTDPLFTDVAKADFTISDPLSGCVDGGNELPEVQKDIAGTSRPLVSQTDFRGDASGFDIGAYEFDEVILDLSAWYFAECYAFQATEENGGVENWSPFLLVVNTDPDNEVKVQLELYYDKFFQPLEPTIIEDNIPANSRRTYNLQQITLDANTNGIAFGIRLVVFNSDKIFAERAAYWNPVDKFPTRSSGFAYLGSNKTALEWFLAEGTSTSNRQTFISILNPTNQEASVDVTFLLEGKSPRTFRETIPPRARTAVAAHGNDRVPNENFATRVTSKNGVPIVVERAVYGNADDVDRKWGHNVSGATEPSSTWYFAEGAVHSTFDTFLLLGNFTNETVVARLTFLLASGDPVVSLIQLPANRRTTINVEADFPEMKDQTGFSTIIETVGGQEIYAERAMFFKAFGFTQRSGATAVFGIREPVASWFLPEGAAFGGSNFETFVLIGNPGEEPATVNVSFILSNGEPIVVERTVGPKQRVTVKANDHLPSDEGTQSFGTVVESTNDVPIICERAMYFQSGGIARIEGHASPGFPR